MTVYLECSLVLTVEEHLMNRLHENQKYYDPKIVDFKHDHSVQRSHFIDLQLTLVILTPLTLDRTQNCNQIMIFCHNWDLIIMQNKKMYKSILIIR